MELLAFYFIPTKIQWLGEWAKNFLSFFMYIYSGPVAERAGLQSTLYTQRGVH